MSRESSQFTKEEKILRNNKSAKDKVEKKAYQCYFGATVLALMGFDVQFMKAKVKTKSVPHFKVLSIKSQRETIFTYSKEFEDSCVDYNGKKNKDIYNIKVMNIILDYLASHGFRFVEKSSNDVKEGSKRPGHKNIQFKMINEASFQDEIYDYRDIRQIGSDVYVNILEHQRAQKTITLNYNDVHSMVGSPTFAKLKQAVLNQNRWGMESVGMSTSSFTIPPNTLYHRYNYYPNGNIVLEAIYQPPNGY